MKFEDTILPFAITSYMNTCIQTVICSTIAYQGCHNNYHNYKICQIRALVEHNFD